MMREREDRSLGELFGELSRETSTLMRQEFALAKAEVRQKATKAGKHVGYVAAGGALAYAALLVLLFAVVALISLALPVWVAALIVGALTGIIAGMLVSRGLKGLKEIDPVPERTVETLKEDVEWAKQQVK